MGNTVNSEQSTPSVGLAEASAAAAEMEYESLDGPSF